MSGPNPGSLGNSFGTPASALKGRLGPKPAPAVPTPPPAPVVVPEQAEPEENGHKPIPKKPRPQTPAADSTPRDVSTSGSYQVSVYLLPSAITAIDRMRERTGKVSAEIAFDALDAMRDSLTDLVTRRQTGEGRPKDSLFPSRRRSSRSTAAQQGRRQLWSLTVRGPELAVLDQLRERFGATSRSELISVAVEAFLLR